MKNSIRTCVLMGLAIAVIEETGIAQEKPSGGSFVSIHRRAYREHALGALKQVSEGPGTKEFRSGYCWLCC